MTCSFVVNLIMAVSQYPEVHKIHAEFEHCPIRPPVACLYRGKIRNSPSSAVPLQFMALCVDADNKPIYDGPVWRAFDT